jgi:3'(2'), 5'-bisphosphate nucleotidase
VQQILASEEARFAAEAVRDAGLLVRRIQRDLVGASLAKDDKSPVTVADFAAQALVAYKLAERFPDAVLVGEEQADLLRSDVGRGTLVQIIGYLGDDIADINAERALELIDRGAGDPPSSFWTLDPIDGTKGFLRNDQYAVALARVENGQVVLGALGCPELEAAKRPQRGGVGSILVAMRGHGTWSLPMGEATVRVPQLKVSAIDDPSKARVLRSFEKAHTDADGIDDLGQSLGIVAEPVAMDSQAKYAVLAAGGAEILLRLLSPSRPDYREKIWDQAAGSIVVEEAGGRVTDLDGKPLDFSQGRTLAGNRGVVATNGRLHDAVLAGLKSIGA